MPAGRQKLLHVTYSPVLVLASLAIAIMASFTALRLTSHLRDLSAKQRKIRVTQGALALGTGIWSMHFVGMLAVQLPVTISYSPLPTLGSALIAVLVTGCALLSLHFGVRTKVRIYVAGTLTGIGIVTMHYVGMSAISGNCLVTFSPIGIVIATLIGIAASIIAMELAYGNRTLRSMIIGSITLGLAISAMHYSAMYFTVFELAGTVSVEPELLLSSNALALVVALSSFIICGLFLLTAIPGDNTAAADPVTGNTEEARPGEDNAEEKRAAGFALSRAGQGPAATAGDAPIRIPYESENAIRFLSASDVLAVRADGHYTKIHRGRDELFCPWSISQFEERVAGNTFIRTHRSFLVNRDHISGFRKDGDKAFCILGAGNDLEIPVSRSRVAALRDELNLG